MGPFPRWALTTPVPGDKRTAVPFACLRLSLGGPWGAAVLGGADNAGVSKALVCRQHGVTFACLRLSLGGPRGAAVSGGRLRFVAEEEDAGGQGPFACSALTTPVLARHSVE